MKKMIDGDDGTSLFGQMTINCPNKDRLNQIFMSQNVYGARLDLIHQVCEQHINEVHLQNELLSKYRLKPAGWSLEYRPMSQDNFYAHASNTGYDKNNYEISYSLGIPATLLSIAIELDSTLPISEYKNSDAIKDWFPHVKNKSDVSENTINWVLDACLLIYFHEVSHVIFGHCEYKDENNNEARALEMDADFNAGSMFGIYLENFSKDGRRASSGEDTLTRVIKAGFLAGIAFKALSSKSEIYHFPTIRVMSFYSGCLFPLIQTGKLEDFNNQQSGDDYYGKFVTDVRAPLLEDLKNSSLKNLVGTEKDIENDYKELMSITAPLRDKLKDGPLNNLKLPVIQRT